jgi:membrane dipeptidase
MYRTKFEVKSDVDTGNQKGKAMDAKIVLDEQQEERALTLHRNSLVIDMHSDVHLDVIRSRAGGEIKVLERRHLPRWKEAGINVVILCTPSKFGLDSYPYRTTPVHHFLLMTDAIHQEMVESPDCFLPILEPDDITKAQREEKVGLMLGTEGAEPVEMDLGLLRCYHRLGLRIMVLTWHHRNQVADGTAEPSNSGLSNFGRTLVKEMNRLGILIDVSHLSKAGVRDVLELSEQPIIASHSNARSLCDHQRNLEDSQIYSIAEKDGIIGVVFHGNFVAAQNPNIFHVLDHLDYIARLVGIDHVGIGPDYCEAQDMVISSRRTVRPDLPLDATCIPYAEGVEDVTKLPNFTRGLISRGYSDTEIQGVLGENFLRLFRKVYKLE